VNEIRHRGIVDIFSFGQLPTREHYFVMEFLQGNAFDKLIKTQAPVPFAQALAWIEETCEALQAAHESGIIHRDIKPSNIFLVDTGRGRPYVKLLDFGIAKLGALKGEATPQTRASVVIGTPDYMSPEQARGKPISPATDIYALGCVLFELVTARRPFKGENSLQTMFMHVEEPAPRASSFNRSVMPELDDLLLWTMQKEPAERPPSAEALRQACEHLRSLMVAQTPTGPNVAVPGTPSGRVPAVRTPIPKSATPSPRSSRQAGVMNTPHPDPEKPAASSSSGWRMHSAEEIGSSTAISGRSKNADQTREQKIVPLPLEETRVRPLTAEELAAPTAKTPIPPGRISTRIETPMLSSPTVPPRADEQEPLVVEKSKAPLFVGLGLAIAVAAGVLIYAATRTTEQPSVNPVVELPVDVNTKPVEVKPVEAKPVETKPVEVKPVETKPVETKPAETKPAETRPAEVKPAETKPAETKPAETKPADAKPSDKKPGDKKPGGLSAQTVDARIAKIEAKLAAKEAASGEPDRVMRQFLNQAKADAKTADTDAKRREVMKTLDDIQHQIDGR